MGTVLHNKGCYKLYEFDGCSQPSVGASIHKLIVNPQTLQLECSNVFDNRLSENEKINEEDGTYENKECFIGGKRSQNGTCKNNE